MDQEKFIELVTDGLSTEHQSIVQYDLPISTVTDPEFVSTIDEGTEQLEWYQERFTEPAELGRADVGEATPTRTDPRTCKGPDDRPRQVRRAAHVSP